MIFPMGSSRLFRLGVARLFCVTNPFLSGALIRRKCWGYFVWRKGSLWGGMRQTKGAFDEDDMVTGTWCPVWSVSAPPATSGLCLGDWLPFLSDRQCMQWKSFWSLPLSVFFFSSRKAACLLHPVTKVRQLRGGLLQGGRMSSVICWISYHGSPSSCPTCRIGWG